MGNIDKEFEVDTLQFGTFDVTYGNNAIRRNEIYDYPAFANTIWDSVSFFPDFVDIQAVDFHLSAGSPLINAGTVTSVLEDIEGKVRSNPDIGCYEF